jgi:hypothetical protein
VALTEHRVGRQLISWFTLRWYVAVSVTLTSISLKSQFYPFTFLQGCGVKSQFVQFVIALL